MITKFIYNFFFSNYYQSYYYYLVTCLTILSNFILISSITKKKVFNNLTKIFGKATNFFHRLYNLKNLLMASLFTCNNDIYIAKLDLIIIKEELPIFLLIKTTNIQIKLTSKISLNLFCIAQKFELLLNNIVLLNKQL